MYICNEHVHVHVNLILSFRLTADYIDVSNPTNISEISFTVSTVDQPNPNPLPAADFSQETNSFFVISVTVQPNTFNPLCVQAWTPSTLRRKRAEAASLKEHRGIKKIIYLSMTSA